MSWTFEKFSGFVNRDPSGIPFRHEVRARYHHGPSEWKYTVFLFYQPKNGKDLYRQSIADFLPDIISPYDWCLENLGPNWGSWGNKNIQLNTNGGQIRTHNGPKLFEYHCEFYFAKESDAMLFRLQLEN